MKPEKGLSQILALTFALWLLTGCGGGSTEPTTALVTPTEAVTTPVESGLITGRVHGQAPPTPAMVVYAVDNTTGVWSAVETQATDGETPFTLDVVPGTYQVFAFARDGDGPYAGYSADGMALTTVTVEAGQTVSDIMVRPPSMSECGPTFGLPASPDGEFAAIDGPAEDCLATTEPPPIVALPDGTPCAFAGTGATLAFDGKRLNYTCEVAGQEVGLLGDLQPQSDGTWLAEKVVLGHNDDGFFIQESEMVTVTAVDESDSVGMANPASVFCEEQGGQLEIRSEAGGDVGYCIFPDGSECEEWAFFRGECAPTNWGVCDNLIEDMVHALGVYVTVTYEVPFIDYINGNTSIGCQLIATGTGLNFENVGVVYDQMAATLQSQNWLEDTQYAGGGATGLLTGYRQDDDLCLLVAEWQPSAEASCPADQPISACELSPEQMLYTVTLTCAQDNTVGQPQDISEVPEVLPLDVPIGFEILFGLADSLMLPSDFPVEAGLPAIVPHVITAEPGEYEISLDYGPECHGAGACHYGSLAGKQVRSNQPESTRNIPYEADRAQQVMLENGIEGYFIEAECGANCDDARVYWIVDGFQYMLGLKGGQQGDVVDLANAAIMNSMWVTSMTPLVAPPGPTVESFTIAAEDNSTGGKNLILTWQTTGANRVEIWRGQAYNARMWEGEPNGTLTIEYGPDKAYEAQDFTLHAFDEQDNIITQDNIFQFPCRRAELFFNPNQCASSKAFTTAAAEQLFEHGRMLWFAQHPEHAPQNNIVVLYNDGTWEMFEDSWQPGEPESDPTVTAPNGLYQPVRGFGKLWRDENLNIREQLGWGLGEEQSFETTRQNHEWSYSPGELFNESYIRMFDGQVVHLNGTTFGRWEVVSSD